jgi:hypothetical protein
LGKCCTANGNAPPEQWGICLVFVAQNMADTLPANR